MNTLTFFTLIGGFVSGILCRSFFDISGNILLIGCSTLLLCALSLTRWRSDYSRAGSLILLLIISYCCGTLRTESVLTKLNTTPLTTLEGAPDTFWGTVVTDPEVRERTTHITLMVDGASRILVFAPQATDASYGDTLEVTGTLEVPQSFASEFGRTFHYREYLLARGVTHTMHTKSLTVTEKSGVTFLGTLYALRHRIIEKVELLIPEPASALGLGITLGEKRALGEDLMRLFQITGLIHIVVLSGYNISIFADFIMRVLTPFFSLRKKLIVGGVAIILLVLMVGPSAAVVRAGCMALLVLIARAAGNTHDVTRALFFVGGLMLLHNPLLLVFDPGFQFSFLATFGLIALAPWIESFLQRIPTVFQIREYLTATLAAQIMVLPLLLYLTGLFSLVSIPANMLVLPVTPLAMLLTALTAGIGFVSEHLAVGTAFLGYLVLMGIIRITEFFGTLPYAAVPVPHFSFLFVVLAYGSIACSILFLKKYFSQKVGAVHASDTPAQARAEPAPDSVFPFR